MVKLWQLSYQGFNLKSRGAISKTASIKVLVSSFVLMKRLLVFMSQIISKELYLVDFLRNPFLYNGEKLEGA